MIVYIYISLYIRIFTHFLACFSYTPSLTSPSYETDCHIFAATPEKPFLAQLFFVYHIYCTCIHRPPL